GARLSQGCLESGRTQSHLPGQFRGPAAGFFLRPGPLKKPPSRPGVAVPCSRSLPAVVCATKLTSGPAFRSLVLQEALVEILDLRHFSSADLRPLLEDEIQVWANALCWDYSGSAEMILRYMDAK